MKYYIRETRQPSGIVLYVVAPPNRYKDASGKLIRTDAVGPEWGVDSYRMHYFPSHRAAARVRNLCGPNAEIREAAK